MSSVTEPSERARISMRIAPMTEHWWVHDDRIDGARSDSYSVYTRAGVIFVDPLPLTYAAADRFPAVTYALLTRGCHQRASWRYRYEHGARIIAPRPSWNLLGEPDQHYVEGTRLPADFKAIRTPGPEIDHYSLYRPGEPSILFIGDLVARWNESTPLRLCQDDPDLAPGISRQSLEKLLDLDLEIDLLCMSHGGYIDEDPKGALVDLYERTA
jgi:glyoxylase-like metal-dependent hydrolase (beta-lactamase superfamily II)